ncbi:MAG: hypothetical protein ABI091_25530 [Ferruginibacter sp.]
MNASNQIDMLDETLKIYFLESAKTDETTLHQELSVILSNDKLVEMPDAMRLKLINRLKDALQQVSFGQLIKEALQSNKIESDNLAELTGLPVPVLKELQADTVFTNNVPIVFLKKLLNSLNISYQAAEQAIRNTFELLQQHVPSSASYNGVTPAFKKGNFSSRESFIKNIPKTSGKELFQNEEALNRYLNRLNELMNS